MRKLQINDPQVGRNMRLFKQFMQKTGKDKGKIVTLFLSRRTGIFNKTDQFPRDSKEWKIVHLKIGGDIPFELEEPFAFSEFQDRAIHTVTETFKLLNTAKELSDVEFVMPGPLSGEDLLNAAWYDISRLGAEDLLLSKPVGTYLFRQDDYTKILEKKLRVEKQHAMRCVTLTFLEPNEKITEKTLVQDGDRWSIYDDDPTLEERAYPSLDALLESLDPFLKVPLTSGK